jgi:hypothetical protein
MQANCFAEYHWCIQDNAINAQAPNMVCTATLINCMNALCYGALGEHLVDRPGEADLTDKASLEATSLA